MLQKKQIISNETKYELLNKIIVFIKQEFKPLSKEERN